MNRRGLGSVLGRAREVGQEAATLARLTRDLPGFLREPLSPAAMRSLLDRRLRERERRFLQVVSRAIYGQAGSPYRWLLRQAGCEWGDVRALVAREGVDGALGILAQQGVYVTFDELNGRRAAVRGSARLTFRPR